MSLKLVNRRERVSGFSLECVHVNKIRLCTITIFNMKLINITSIDSYTRVYICFLTFANEQGIWCHTKQTYTCRYEHFYIVYNICVYFWLHSVCGYGEGLDSVNQFYKTSWVIVVSPSDRPKSVRNRCVIEICGSVFAVTFLGQMEPKAPVTYCDHALSGFRRLSSVVR